ncbi:F0F1 ATP synthase subunit beta [Mycoplasma mycoides]|uniref:F0F1 ATP synthase subunit beta n=1 Tax=Mycoplasma mycoides TaxID=2102 RepID=UPI001018B7F4|nr:F0F1 ATP synthase subunit beta [Mycoplasma mycoides]SRX64352.1 F0F1 ATP synthase subunit beta [Mycoplasma mycoides subsp. capri]
MNGKILSISGDVIEVQFEKSNLPSINHLLTTHDNQTYLLVKSVINETNIKAIIIYAYKQISLSDEIINTNKSFMVPVGSKAKNNIFSFTGISLNNKKDDKQEYVEMNSTINNKRELSTEFELIETGIIFKGFKLGIFGGAGVGKTVLMKEIIFNVNNKYKNTSNIFIGSGERSREGIELYDELTESNLMKNSTMFVSKMNESPGARMSIVPIGVTAAEYLRDVKKEDVLLFIDNIYRFIQAENEVSATLGKKPSVGGYQSTLESDVANIQDRLFKNKNGAITSFQTVFLPMDDLSDPSAVAVFNHLDSILILGFDELDAESKILVKKALQLENFFTQYFFMTEQFTKQKGQYVPLNETIDSVIRIIEGKYIKQSPEIFSYIGSALDLKTDEELGL